MSEFGFSGDPRYRDITSMLELGINPFVAEQGETVETADRLRAAYDFAWQQMFDTAFSPYETEDDDAATQLLSAFQKLWVMKDGEAGFETAVFASICSFSRGEINQVPFVFDGAPSFYEGEFLRRVEELCRDGKIQGATESPEILARLLVSYANVVFVSWFMLPEANPEFDQSMAHLGIKSMMTGGEPSPYS